MTSHRPLAILVAVGATALVLAGCVAKSDVAATDALKVTSTETGCDVSSATATSGTLSFDVSNKGEQVSEFYILAEDGLRIIGEAENIAPGASRTLTVVVQPGDYFTVCKPGMVGDGVGRAAFSVTGDAVTVKGPDAALKQQAVDLYAAFVKDQVAQLVPAAKAFVASYEAGDDAAAKAAFPNVRAFYERIEPVAESLGDLDPRIDYREVDAVAAGMDWTGFHRIEKDLWVPAKDALNSDGATPAWQDWAPSTPAERASHGDQLVADVQTLFDYVHSDKFQAALDAQGIAGISNGAIGLLDEVATSKITGEEDWWSGTDLWDFAANVEGSKAAFSLVRDFAAAQGEGGTALVSKIDTGYRDLEAALAKHGSLAKGFVTYSTLTEADKRELVDLINALAEPMSKLTATVLADMADKTQGTEGSGGVSRRGLLGLAVGASAAGFALGAGAGAATGVAVGRARAESATSAHPFFGAHQAGITTSVQDHLHFASFDMAERTSRHDLVSLLQDWTYAAARMTQGLEVSATGAVGGSPEAPPDDTGEAQGLPASNLTITIGFGPTLFVQDGVDRYGIAAQRPASLERLPAFVGDDLDPEASGGDLCIQTCADDPQVAVHAIRNLSRIAFGRASLRWSQLGFGRTSRTTTEQVTPRNLFGFKDGTRNILADDTAALAKHVWVSASDSPAWMTGGSYLVARKIAMLIETWDRVRLVEQDDIIGRTKGEGAPLSGGDEHTEPNFHAVDASGMPKIPANSHMRLAHADANDGTRILRRGYNFVDGNNDLGRMDAGLFFLSYQRDPEQFIRIQQTLSKDAMNEYIRHVRSGLWAIPPGATAGSYVGAGLFA